MAPNLSPKSSIGFFFVAALLIAQDSTRAPQDLTLHISVNLVQVDAVVTDSKGHPVTDLRAEDFEIREDGKVQKVTAFSHVQLKHGAVPSALVPKQKPSLVDLSLPSAPKREEISRYVVLVADDLDLSWESTAYVRRALKRFIERQMQPGDLVAIIRTSRGGNALQNFTNNKLQLEAAVESVRFNLNGNGGLFPFAQIYPTPTPLGPGGSGKKTSDSQPTLDVQEILADLDSERQQQFFISGGLRSLIYMIRGLRELPGRKAIIYFSDGIPVSLKGTNLDETLRLLEKVTDESNRASVVLNTIDARGLQTLGADASDNPSSQDGPPSDIGKDRRNKLVDSQAGLDYLATQTGGRFLHDGNDFNWSIDRVLEDLDSYYLIGYTPSKESFDKTQADRFHRLRVRVLRPGLHLRTRSGFFGVGDEEYLSAPKGTEQILRAALDSPFHANDIPLRLTCLFEQEDTPEILVYLHVDASKLQFEEQPDGARTAGVEILVTGQHQDGETVDVATLRAKIEAPPGEWETIRKSGFLMSSRLRVPRAGGVQVRAAIRDQTSGFIGSTGDFLVVPDLKKGRLAIGGLSLGRTDAKTGSDNAAVRAFPPGANVPFKVSIFNAKRGRGDKPAELTARVRIFHDGDLVSTTPDINVAGVLTARRQVAHGSVRIMPDWKPGDYYVQVIVTRRKSEKSAEQAIAWSDFNIQTRKALQP